MIGTIDPLFPLVPVFGVVFRDGFPLLRERKLPRDGVAKFCADLFFCGTRGFVFSVVGGVSAANRQTVGQIAVHH